MKTENIRMYALFLIAPISLPSFFVIRWVSTISVDACLVYEKCRLGFILTLKYELQARYNKYLHHSNMFCFPVELTIRVVSINKVQF